MTEKSKTHLIKRHKFPDFDICISIIINYSGAIVWMGLENNYSERAPEIDQLTNSHAHGFE
jgi:hypothetical protein